MTDKFLAGGSIFNESATGWPEDHARNFYAWEGDAEPGEEEPPPRYWNALAVGIALGMVVGIVLAWMPAGLIIWRLWK